jgi:hypothetical protein
MKITSLVIVLGCCAIAGCQRHETSGAIDPPSLTQPVAEGDPANLVGTWLRPDGGYVLEIRAATADGKLDAGYFNPNPIHVSQATWRKNEGGGLYVFIELRDTGYPGATYKLNYQKVTDQLTGAYHQPTHGQTFAVEFVRP